jgi:hypothetical protein
MDFHEVIITLLMKERTTRYDLAVNVGVRSKHDLYTTLESAMDSFYPPISPRVRSHIAERVRGERKPVIFRLEDSFEEQ